MTGDPELDKVTLAFTKCSCGKSYLVGFNGKDLRGTKSADASGHLDGTPYIGFGNDTLAKLPELTTNMTVCPNCSQSCEIVISG